jgi:hypothetical protein
MMWGVGYTQSLQFFIRSALGLIFSLPIAVFGAPMATSIPTPGTSPQASVSLIVTLPDGTQQLLALQPTDKNGASLLNSKPVPLDVTTVPTYKFSITANSQFTTTTLSEINLNTGAKLHIPLNYWMAVAPEGPDELGPGEGGLTRGAAGPTTATPDTPAPSQPVTRTFSAPNGTGLQEGDFQVVLPVPMRGQTLYFGTILAGIDGDGVLTGNGADSVAVRERRDSGLGSSPRLPSGSNATSALPGCSLSVVDPTKNAGMLAGIAMAMSLLLALALRIRRNHNKA